jgi:signal transduction histidine kinase
MQASRLGIRAEIVLHITVLTIISILLLSYIVLKITKNNLLYYEKLAAQQSLVQLQHQLAESTESPEWILNNLAKFNSFTHFLQWDAQGNGLPGDAEAGTLSVLLQQRLKTERIFFEEKIERNWWGTNRSHLVNFYLLIEQAHTIQGYLRVDFDMGRIDQAITRSKLPVFLYAALYSILLALFAYFVLSRMIIAPIEQMRRVAGKIAAGEIQERIPVYHGDELGQLAVVINQMTEKLVDNQEEIVQREKLAAVGRLAAGLAHEIGNPLGAILGYVDILKQPDAFKEHPELLPRIEKELLRISTIIRELLGYARSKKLEVGNIAVNELIRSTYEEILNPQLRQKVSVVYQFDETPRDPIKVRMDRNQLEQVLVNLLVNACHSIQQRYLDHEVGKIEFTTRTLQEKVIITVSDNGTGIATEHLKRIFEPFFSTKEPGKGTGLGLYICSSILKMWGGEITVDSVLAERTTFTISLPKA